MFKETYPERISVAFCPYTYVRVMAMKSKLYSKQDYDKLLKMHGNEIASYLEDTDYKEDIHALGKEFSGYALVEHSLSLNLVRNIQKLQMICLSEMRWLIHAYILRHDIYNLKTIIRAKASGKVFSEICSLLLPSRTLTEEKLSTLFQHDSLLTILKKAGFSERDVKDAIHYYQKEKSLLEIENFLDKQYYNFLFGFLQRLAGEHTLFREFLQSEIDVLNIKLLLRMKKKLIEENRIINFFFEGGSSLPLRRLRIFAKYDFSGVIRGLQTTPFKPLVAQYHDKLAEKNLHEFEKALDVWLLQKSTLLLHQFPLSVDTILGYMFAKEIEVRNLRVIVKGKQLNMPKDFIEKQLVVA